MSENVKVVVRKGILSKSSKLFKHSFLLIFLAIIIINAIVISINTQDPVFAIKEIGGRIFFATNTLQEESAKIIEQGGVYDDSKGVLYSTWTFLKYYFKLFEAIYSIVIWLKILTIIVAWTPISGESARNVVNFSLSLFIFFITQMLFLAVFPPEGLTSLSAVKLPFSAFYTLFKAFPYIISPIAGIVSKIKPNNSGELVNTTISAINNSIS